MLDEKKAAEFVKHDFIIKFHFAFQTQSSFFIGMEYVPGGDLLSQLKQHGTLSEDDAKFYVAEVTLALEYLHKNNIIHRDVKPENILIARDGHIRLADFGLSKFLDLQNGQTTKRLCGTVEYMAPEMFRKTGYSTSVDWWALGILTYDVTQGQVRITISSFSDNFMVIFLKADFLICVFRPRSCKIWVNSLKRFSTSFIRSPCLSSTFLRRQRISLRACCM